MDGEIDGRVDIDGGSLIVTVGVLDGGNDQVGEVLPGATDDCIGAIASANRSKIEDGLFWSDSGFNGVDGASVVCPIAI